MWNSGRSSYIARAMLSHLTSLTIREAGGDGTDDRPVTAAWLSLDLTKSNVAHPPRRWHLGPSSPIARRRNRLPHRLAATRNVVVGASLLLGMLTGNLTTNSVDPEKEVDGHFRGREKNIIVNDETKQKPMLLKGAPRGTSVQEKHVDVTGRGQALGSFQQMINLQ
ncbi:hypothetical protein CEP51_002038 [Fusarium floridanum]|uniref:Uncharacterized protein n=1 Tax=Fusarium floridanum TaxID=1325733 RepID=A0A428SDH1_9HYPO|nr:hypothetical protein CEP51_002038 [Fusarium floridanum]